MKEETRSKATDYLNKIMKDKNFDIFVEKIYFARLSRFLRFLSEKSAFETLLRF